MIKIVIGGVGSGKSITLARMVLEASDDAYVNFHLRSPKARRLELSHILEKKEIGRMRTGKPIYETHVNWDFWRDNWKKGGFEIIIDEAQNVLNARAAMSSWNKYFTQWLAQIRKVLGSSGSHDLVLASQRIENIDVIARDLAHEIIHCQKIELPQKVLTPVVKNHHVSMKALPQTYIMHHVFRGANALRDYYAWADSNAKSYYARRMFLGNPYFKYFDSYAFIDFGHEAYL